MAEYYQIPKDAELWSETDERLRLDEDWCVGPQCPTCAACGMRKHPRGRSPPMEAANSYCAHECEGHDQPPHAGDLWPGEKRWEFGYGYPDTAAGILIVHDDGRRERVMR